MYQYTTLFNYIYILYIILHPAISRLIIGFDGAGHIYMLLAFVIAFLNFNNRAFWSEFKIQPIFIWCIWCIYAATTWYFHGINSTNLESYIFIFDKIFNPFITLFITCHESHKNPKRISKLILIGYIIYVILGIILQEPSGKGMRGGELLGNGLSLNGVCLVAIASICYIKGWCGKKIYILSIFLCTYAVIYVATRKALFSELIIISSVLLAKFNIKNLKDISLMTFAIIVIYIAYSYILDNTLLGERLSTIEDSSTKWNTTSYSLLNFLGDRAYFYINGWQLFLDHPIIGIGLFNFGIFMNSRLPIHSEYIVQLCELGLIGSFIYIGYISSIFKKIKQLRVIRENKISLVFYGWMASLLFISLTTWTYEFPRYFLITGIIIGYCSRLNNKKTA